MPLQISAGFAPWQRYCTASSSGHQPKVCGVEQRAPPMFGRVTITLGIGPHSSSQCLHFKNSIIVLYLAFSASPPTPISTLVLVILAVLQTPVVLRPQNRTFADNWSKFSTTSDAEAVKGTQGLVASHQNYPLDLVRSWLSSCVLRSTPAVQDPEKHSKHLHTLTGAVSAQAS